MNAFDLAVTVALGSTLATILLNRQVTVAQGAAALVSLVLLQFATAWASVRFRSVRSLVKAEPALLLRDGRAYCGDQDEVGQSGCGRDTEEFVPGFVEHTCTATPP
ncbi:hypothetical protein [Streptomyces sp. EN23]|uniref:hypothetical protein n=1 Tax=Streptomyces sp. EN23 TaxID=212774 RepID=UPI00114D2260|nr:hypothetical protein [Streptomyces sp. EN23]